MKLLSVINSYSPINCRPCDRFKINYRWKRFFYLTVNHQSRKMFKNVSQKILADVKREQVVNALFKEPKKSRRQLFKEWFKDKIQEFCSVTSLHGYGEILNKLKLTKYFHPLEKKYLAFKNFPFNPSSSHNSKGLSSRWAILMVGIKFHRPYCRNSSPLDIMELECRDANNDSNWINQLCDL